MVMIQTAYQELMKCCTCEFSLNRYYKCYTLRRKRSARNISSDLRDKWSRPTLWLILAFFLVKGRCHKYGPIHSPQWTPMITYVFQNMLLNFFTYPYTSYFYFFCITFFFQKALKKEPLLKESVFQIIPLYPPSVGYYFPFFGCLLPSCLMTCLNSVCELCPLHLSGRH